MSSLSDRLKSLGVSVGAQNIQSPHKRKHTSLEQVLPGRVHQNQNGETYVVEAFYPADYLYGRTSIQTSKPLSNIATWAGNGDPQIASRISQCQHSGFAFLDIETTGLMGGTGTYAFLVGIARFDDQGFHLAQFFMRDPSEEPAHLLAVEEFVAPCETLVTYNGKAFDVPLLNTRYIYQGWKPPLPAFAHIDLLQLARRIWRDRLPSRTLGNVEIFILEARRTEEDVPGWMIPQLYFDYLSTGDVEPLKGVFYHNAMDVLAMAALLAHFNILIEEPQDNHTLNPLDMVGIARFYEDLGRINEACQIYQRCLETDLPRELFWNTVERLSFIQKRQGNYQTAINLWEKAAGEGHIYAHVELAKYYEHQARLMDEALFWAGKALQIVSAPGSSSMIRQAWLAELEHRINRLQRKLMNSLE
jgi:uncharacterized protein